MVLTIRSTARVLLALATKMEVLAIVHRISVVARAVPVRVAAVIQVVAAVAVVTNALGKSRVSLMNHHFHNSYSAI